MMVLSAHRKQYQHKGIPPQRKKWWEWETRSARLLGYMFEHGSVTRDEAHEFCKLRSGSHTNDIARHLRRTGWNIYTDSERSPTTGRMVTFWYIGGYYDGRTTDRWYVDMKEQKKRELKERKRAEIRAAYEREVRRVEQHYENMRALGR